MGPIIELSKKTHKKKNEPRSFRRLMLQILRKDQHRAIVQG